jgi:hypothetical protein
MAQLIGVELRGSRCPTFESIVAPILPWVGDCAWAFEGEAPFTALPSTAADPFPGDDELLQLFDVAIDDSQRPIWDCGWLRPGSVDRMMRFVQLDWLDVYAVTAPPFPRSLVGRDHVVTDMAALPGIRLHMECVDGAFWRAWSPIPQIMQALTTQVGARQAQWARTVEDLGPDP